MNRILVPARIVNLPVQFTPMYFISYHWQWGWYNHTASKKNTKMITVNGLIFRKLLKIALGKEDMNFVFLTLNYERSGSCARSQRGTLMLQSTHCNHILTDVGKIESIWKFLIFK